MAIFTCELFGDALEQFLDGSGISNKCGGHFQPPWRNIAHGSLDVIGNPFNEVTVVLCLNVQHLFVHFLINRKKLLSENQQYIVLCTYFHGHSTSENGGNSEISTVAWVTRCHHVLGVKHLLSQLWYRESPILCISWSSFNTDNFSSLLTSFNVMLPRDVSGANPGMKKWSRGNGTILTASLRRSALSWPGNRRQVVTPDIVAETEIKKLAWHLIGIS